jgi:hypothetical protein
LARSLASRTRRGLVVGATSSAGSKAAVAGGALGSAGGVVFLFPRLKRPEYQQKWDRADLVEGFRLDMVGNVRTGQMTRYRERVNTESALQLPSFISKKGARGQLGGRKPQARSTRRVRCGAEPKVMKQEQNGFSDARAANGNVVRSDRRENTGCNG